MIIIQKWLGAYMLMELCENI